MTEIERTREVEVAGQLPYIAWSSNGSILNYAGASATWRILVDVAVDVQRPAGQAQTAGRSTLQCSCKRKWLGASVIKRVKTIPL
ncbi:hypothetical protein, partial [Serratia marcescens]|uniref:hypothetical protein n=1 Tax=Serratia marcescens TaxID=615 RepID=UPI002813FDAD